MPTLLLSCYGFVLSKQHTQIFEDLYRETHGLPPRKKRPTSIRGSSPVDPSPLENDDQDAETEVPAEKSDEDTAVAEGTDGRLVDDTDVARLLAELQADIDTDDSDWEAGEPGMDGEAPETTTGKDSEQVPADTTCVESRCAEQGGKLQVVDDLEVAADRSCPSSQIQDRPNQDGDEPSVAQSRGTQPEEDRPTVDGSHQRAAEDKLSRAMEHRVDISRMKIDGPQRGARVGPRPQSAPSACFSSGKFSRLSRTSSSRLSRTVSQKVLKATKEAEERASSEAQQGGGIQRRAPGSVSAPARTVY